MKHKTLGALILALVMVSTTFATNIEDNVNQKVLTTFNQQFVNAKEIKWIIKENYIKASFTLNEKSLSAFYTKEGDLIGVLANISSLQLPTPLQMQLKKNLTEGWITELVEFSSEAGIAYYVTIDHSDEKTILRSDDGVSWYFYKKLRMPS